MSEPNGVMMQFFHWYTPADGNLWKEFANQANELAAAGITAVLLPPAHKGSSGGLDVGYSVYDLYDLGEFDQKGSIRTKYGTKHEYIHAIQAAKTAGLKIYSDVILNHMVGGDATEDVEATPLNRENQKDVIGENRIVRAWTHFTFPGRKGKYSSMEWHWWHFDAVDYDANDKHFNAIYVFKGKSLQDDGDLEDRTTAFLIGCDLDTQSKDVRDALKLWGDWYVKTTQIDGFRFDAVKHVRSDFFTDFLQHCCAKSGKDLFAVGEYWSSDSNLLQKFIDRTGGKIHLFDVPLHYNLSRASQSGNDYDLTTIFDHTLVKQQPALAVTMVDNHDSQPLQTSESSIEPWFKPQAYALILLRQAGYPCIFYADYYGAHYTDVDRDGRKRNVLLDGYRWLIDRFLYVRHTYAFGKQNDYFNHPNTIGWTRMGDNDHPGGMAVVITNGDNNYQYMQVGLPNCTYYDITEHLNEPVTTNDKGWARFNCAAGSVSVWVAK